MALTIQRKKQIVADVHHQAQVGLSLVAAEYSGLTVRQMTALRNKARAAGIFLKVIKNSLARKAFEGTSFMAANDSLKGQLVYFIGREAPGVAARLARDFAKENDKLKVRVLAVGHSVYDAQHLDAVAKLPTKDEALAQLLACMQAPITKFVQTLAAPSAKLVRTLSAVQESKS
ncbi:MAG: 50S ribosomal protein L10 [Gammaproteobacteria bacterium]|nr:50S ribosomal protein L10 [Gammaproteobacteria bacterium]